MELFLKAVKYNISMKNVIEFVKLVKSLKMLIKFVDKICSNVVKFLLIKPYCPLLIEMIG